MCRKIKLISNFTPLIKINSKWIKDSIMKPETINLKILNLIPETVKIPERNMRKISDFGLSSDFLDVTQKA